ncbi:MAG: histidine kinase dimerization/phospho-acceptor domain-containing protein [Terracidiphilus sp.]|nr:histidine kinase dimerization/phospho-acceptor domain-containing protein [Terracidiphilus sp.]
MPDYYHVPALVLSALLLPAFGYLYWRFRDTRTLLWFLGFLFALASMTLRYIIEWPWEFNPQIHFWMLAIGQGCALVGSALFLASLTPASFRIGRWRVLYVVPYTIPLVLASFLLNVVFHGITPAGPPLFIFPALGAVSLLVALFWGAAQNGMPGWLGVAFCALMGGLSLVACFVVGATWALIFVESSNLLMTALLLVFVFRRISPGVLLSVMGFTAWSLTALEIIPAISLNSSLDLNLIHIIVMAKVVAAAGMILLALEDELNINKAAQESERRARRELEAYANLILARRRVEDFDHQGTDICDIVVKNSRFAQAALLLESAGRYRLVGSAGLDEATAAALSDLAVRIMPANFLAPGSVPTAVEHSQTLNLDLTPWLSPGDDLKRLRFTQVLAVPMRGRTIVEGVLLLSAMRPTLRKSLALPGDPLRADDLLPIEMLVARLQATRSQTMLFEKLIDSEKYAGLGQLAANVTHHLNNPLTVVLGYASLLEETIPPEAPERKGIESILTEARRMRSTLESLSRVARTPSDQRAAISVAELLADMEQLHRSELLQRSIDFRLSIAPSLPRVMCSAQQLRQAVLHCLQYSIAAVEKRGPASSPEEPKTIRLEATSEGHLVQILVAHSGPGFLNPERAFDPFTPAQAVGETAGLGLSLCATILRDHNGRASAVNLEPRGAAIILELQAA